MFLSRLLVGLSNMFLSITRVPVLCALSGVPAFKNLPKRFMCRTLVSFVGSERYLGEQATTQVRISFHETSLRSSTARLYQQYPRLTQLRDNAGANEHAQHGDGSEACDWPQV